MTDNFMNGTPCVALFDACIHSSILGWGVVVFLASDATGP